MRERQVVSIGRGSMLTLKFAENCMRKSVLLVVVSSALSIVAACGGKLTDAETRETMLPDGAIIGTGGSDNTGGAGGSDNTGGSGGNGGGIDPGGTTGSGGSGGTGGATTGSGGSTTGTGATGGTGGSGGPGGSGSGGGSIDAGAACPVMQPANGAECATTSPCSYGATICSCANSGGQGGNRRDAGSAWSCTGSGGGSVDAGGRRG